jgi:ankyrin repeat protein
MGIKTLIDNKDLEGLEKMLSDDPALANEDLPYDEQNTAKAHPLHRICDGVFSGKYTDDEAVEMARIFLRQGAKVDGVEVIENRDTPLVAAASLHAEKVGILYLEQGADIHHAGCHGGTALHWAAWTGRDQLVKRLIAEKAEINKRCVDFQGTPLLWALHGYKFGGKENRYNQVECVKHLLSAGADKSVPNKEGHLPIEFANDSDMELLQLLK